MTEATHPSHHDSIEDMAQQLAELKEAFDDFRRDLEEREDLIEEQHRTAHRQMQHPTRTVA